MNKAQEAEMLDSAMEEEEGQDEAVVYGDGPGEVCPRRQVQGMTADQGVLAALGLAAPRQGVGAPLAAPDVVDGTTDEDADTVELVPMAMFADPGKALAALERHAAPCPRCDTNTIPDGGGHYICPSCQYEWLFRDELQNVQLRAQQAAPLRNMPCMAIPIVEPARYGIVQTITRWNDAEKKLVTVLSVDERTFRNDEAGTIEALEEHTWRVGEEAVICCTTVLREMSPSGPGRIVEAWHYPIGRGTD